MKEKIRVLIADDSVVFRSMIRAALDGVDDIEVVGVASNGRIALEKIKVLPVDLLILDLEMPELDGIGVLKELSSQSFTLKILLFSSHTQKGARITLEALELGASDFVTKPDALTQGVDPKEKIKGLVLPKIRGLFNFKVATDLLQKSSPHIECQRTFTSSLFELMKPQLIVIGCSTGGPAALESIFQNIQGLLRCPIIIVQHMPPLFTASLAERIQKITGIPCHEAIDGEELQNQIYIAPGNYHLRLKASAGKIFLQLSQDDLINYVRPAVDPLFQTASDIFKERCLGFVLTGMGQDGKAGTAHIKQNGGAVIIQNEATCVVFGMPGAVKAQGSFDFEKDLPGIATILSAKALTHF